MPAVFEYLLKLSISLGIVYLFYQVALRRLTFYNWNRGYLIGYTILSFFIPFIDISPVLQERAWVDSEVVQWVPLIGTSTTDTGLVAERSGFTTWNFLSLIILLGAFVLTLRLIIQLISVRRMMRKAKLVHHDGLKLYQVEEDIMPFSFGNSIFINRNLHNEEELREIIIHEFIHVRQRHSLDILWGEILCLLNWYNPFAWLLRRSIRQNLEFIADNKVLEFGVNPRQYQYLLLKVIGNNHFSIAPKFNFSSLKKRIAMMNKMKTAGVHLVKFLFILPFVAVLLIAFRQKDNSDCQEPMHPVKPAKLTPPPKPSELSTLVFTDTVPAIREINSKGYLINVKGAEGHCIVVVSDKNGKEIDRVLLTDWNESLEKYEEKYGEILPPPPVAPVKPVEMVEMIPTVAPVPPLAPIDAIRVIPTTIDAPCIKADPALTPVPTTRANNSKLWKLSARYDVTEKFADIWLRDGSHEYYDFSKPEMKAKFESKYGRMETITASPNAIPTLYVDGTSPAQTVLNIPRNAPRNLDYTSIITGGEDVLVTITDKTTKEELEGIKKTLKEKGVELVLEKVEYEEGILKKITGTMTCEGSQSNFVVCDFKKLFLGMKKKGNQVYLKVSTKENTEVI